MDRNISRHLLKIEGTLEIVKKLYKVKTCPLYSDYSIYLVDRETYKEQYFFNYFEAMVTLIFFKNRRVLYKTLILSFLVSCGYTITPPLTLFIFPIAGYGFPLNLPGYISNFFFHYLIVGVSFSAVYIYCENYFKIEKKDKTYRFFLCLTIVEIQTFIYIVFSIWLSNPNFAFNFYIKPLTLSLILGLFGASILFFSYQFILEKIIEEGWAKVFVYALFSALIFIVISYGIIIYKIPVHTHFSIKEWSNISFEFERYWKSFKPMKGVEESEKSYFLSQVEKINFQNIFNKKIEIKNINFLLKGENKSTTVQLGGKLILNNSIPYISSSTFDKELSFSSLGITGDIASVNIFPYTHDKTNVAFFSVPNNSRVTFSKRPGKFSFFKEVQNKKTKQNNNEEPKINSPLIFFESTDPISLNISTKKILFIIKVDNGSSGIGHLTFFGGNGDEVCKLKLSSKNNYLLISVKKDQSLGMMLDEKKMSINTNIFSLGNPLSGAPTRIKNFESISSSGTLIYGKSKKIIHPRDIVKILGDDIFLENISNMEFRIFGTPSFIIYNDSILNDSILNKIPSELIAGVISTLLGVVLGFKLRKKK